MLQADLKYRMEEKLHEIAKVIYSFDYRSYEKIDILGGLSGLIPFLFEYSKHFNKAEYSDLGESLIYEIIERLENQISDFSYSAGIAGFGLVLEQLFEKSLLERSTILHPFDPQFCDTLKMNLKNDNWDALHGAIGIGLYLFKRIENSQVRKTLEQMVDWFEENAIATEKGLKWNSRLNPEEGKIYNLGLAHGVPSIIYFLSMCIKNNIRTKKSKTLLQSLMNHFLNYKNHDFQSFQYFFPANEKRMDTGPRLAWCYGDLGIATSIFHLNKNMGGHEILLKEILQHLTSRKDLKSSRIYDAGFCHGAAGVLHIFHFFKRHGYKEISSDDLNFWLQKTLDFEDYKQSDHYAGFTKFKPGESPEHSYAKDIGLLTGINGIAKTFLSFLNRDLSWSSCLMV